MVTIEAVLDIVNDCLPTNNENKCPISGQLIDEDLTNYGMESIVFIKLIVALEKYFDCEIPDEKLLVNNMNTVNKIVSILKEQERTSA